MATTAGRLWSAQCRVEPRAAAAKFRALLKEHGTVAGASRAIGLTPSAVYLIARQVPLIGAEIDRLRDRQEGKR